MRWSLCGWKRRLLNYLQGRQVSRYDEEKSFLGITTWHTFHSFPCSFPVLHTNLHKILSTILRYLLGLYLCEEGGVQYSHHTYLVGIFRSCCCSSPQLPLLLMLLLWGCLCPFIYGLCQSGSNRLGIIGYTIWGWWKYSLFRCVSQRSHPFVVSYHRKSTPGGHVLELNSRNYILHDKTFLCAE